MSIWYNHEYGGMICKDKNMKRKKYWATNPVSGNEASVDPQKSPCPKKCDIVGNYHTHGDYTEKEADGKMHSTTDPARDIYGSGRFSNQDKKMLNYDANGNPDFNGYLGTPSGDFRKYNPTTRKDSPLQ